MPKVSLQDRQDENSGSQRDIFGDPNIRKRQLKQTSKNLEMFYEEASPRKMNLLHDFVESELFIIDGDSLLFDLLGTPSLAYEHGGQILHLIYLVERFLNNFAERQGVFQIVFFTDFELLWSNKPSMLMTRRLLIEYLKLNTDIEVLSTQFKNCTVPEWQSFLEVMRPLFVLQSDGESTLQCQDQERVKLMVSMFHMLLAVNQINKVNSVYGTGINYTSYKLYGFYVECTAHLRSMARTRAFLLMSKGSTQHRLRCSPIDQFQVFLKLVKSDVEKESCLTEDSLSQTHSLLKMLADAFKITSAPVVIKSARYLLHAAACSQTLNRNLGEENYSTVLDCVKIFLVHLVLSKHLPINYRAQNLGDLETWKWCSFMQIAEEFLEQIQVCCSLMLPELSKEYFHGVDKTCLSDFMDCRLFYKTVILLAAKSASDPTEDIVADCLGFTELMLGDLNQLWSVIITLTERSEPLFPLITYDQEHFPSKETIDSYFLELADVKSAQDIKYKVLPIDNELVDEFAGDVYSSLPKLDSGEIEADYFMQETMIFDETYHWHSGKSLLLEGPVLSEELPPTDPWQRKWFLKQKQLHSRFIHGYASSLEGDNIHQEAIVVSKHNKSELKQAEKQGKKQKGIAKVSKAKNAAQNIKDENIQKKKDDEETQSDDYLKEKMKIWQECIDHLKVIQEVSTFLSDKKVKSEKSVYKARLLKVERCARAWKMTCHDAKKGEQKNPDLFLVVELLEVVIQLVEDHADILRRHPSKCKQLVDSMVMLGFEECTEIIQNKLAKQTTKTVVPYESKGEQALPKEDSPASSSSFPGANQFEVKMSCAEFQMEHMGHLLKRDVCSDPDPRVQHFIPDLWQRKLLDAVDRNNSAIICAPTSSGKTYASYYCMKKILLEGNDGVVVYVSPTKALVNQVHATVYARFSQKKMPDGKAVVGVFTRDYREKALNCQVLVTVPQCLEILLLAPHNQDWVKRIRYVIFDEMHCIGSEEDAGEVWERIMLLINCPFIGLSATLSNPYDLKKWLSQAQQGRKLLAENTEDSTKSKKTPKKGEETQVELVIYEDRFSDLVKYVYFPKPPSEPMSSKKQSEVWFTEDEVLDESEFVHIHPITTLSYNQLRSSRFPRDLTFSSKECLELYNTMQDVENKTSGSISLELKDLEPSKLFQGKMSLSKSDIKSYGNALKDTLKKWNDSGKQHQVAEVSKNLHTNAQIERKNDACEQVYTDPNIMIAVNILKLLEQLKAQNKLPALIFCLDRSMIEYLAHTVALDLEQREEEQREKMTSTLKTQQKQVDKIKKKQLKQLERAKARKEKLSLNDLLEEDDALLMKDPDVPDVNCTFAMKGSGLTRQAMEKSVNYSIPESNWQVLKRGIGYHHGGCGAKMKGTVERLFRERSLGAVFATGTLALGIHMPCRTVVFLGDSPYLDSLQYRQMSGRAGRRGYDPTGDVIFFGINLPKVKRLISSDLPHIKGIFPLSTGLVLRLMLFYSKADDKNDAKLKVLTMLKNSLMTLEHKSLQNQLEYFFIFSLEYLMREGLMNFKGEPTGFAGLASHIHYTEPGNLAFITLLKKQVFHKLLESEKDTPVFSDETLRSIVLILCHIFKCLPLHHSHLKFMNREDVKGRSSSKVLLGQLPEFARKAIDDHNENARQVFKNFVEVLAGEVREKFGLDRQLPLSNIEFPVPSESTSSHPAVGSLVGMMKHNAITYKACSSFVMLSGNYYEEDVSKLVDMVRNEIYLDHDLVPVLEIALDSDGNEMPLNAYLLDFFRHGQLDPLTKFNKIRGSDLYETLKDFMMILSSISTALEQLGPQTMIQVEEKEEDYEAMEMDCVIRAFKQIRRQFTEKFKAVFPDKKQFRNNKERKPKLRF